VGNPEVRCRAARLCLEGDRIAKPAERGHPDGRSFLVGRGVQAAPEHLLFEPGAVALADAAETIRQALTAEYAATLLLWRNRFAGRALPISLAGLSLTIYCSLMLGSSVISLPPNAQLAAMGLAADKALGAVSKALSGASRAGFPVGDVSVPAPAATVIASIQSPGELSQLADVVLRDGIDKKMTGRTALLFGFGAEAIPYKSIIIDEAPNDTDKHDVNAIVFGGSTYLIFSRTIQNDLWMFRTSLDGHYGKGVHFVRHSGGATEETEIAKGQEIFAREKDYWRAWLAKRSPRIR
jgi:hypothetical protein